MQSNVTDPDSRIMKSSAEGFQHCSNAETVVDETHPIIVGSVVGLLGAATRGGLCRCLRGCARVSAL